MAASVPRLASIRGHITGVMRLLKRNAFQIQTHRGKSRSLRCHVLLRGVCL